MVDLLVGIAYVVIALFVLSGSGIDLRHGTRRHLGGHHRRHRLFVTRNTLRRQRVMGGVALQMERTIRVGDWIRVGDLEGQVVEIRWRQTSIETREWDTMVIPNSLLMKGSVTLLGRRLGEPVQRRRWLYFNVDFRRAPTEVIHTVENALLAEPMDGVAVEPKPHCIVTAFAESYATYAARYWLTDLARPDPVDSLVRTRVFSALRRAGIPLSMPAHAVFMTEDDASNRDRKLHEQMEHRVAALAQNVDLPRAHRRASAQLALRRLKGGAFRRGRDADAAGSGGALALSHRHRRCGGACDGRWPHRACGDAARGRLLRRDGHADRRGPHRHGRRDHRWRNATGSARRISKISCTAARRSRRTSRTSLAQRPP